MRELLTSRYRARLAGSAQDLQAAQALRQLAFRYLGAGLDADEFDDGASHLLIETLEGQAVATFRIATFADGDALSIAYAAQFYDLRAYAAQSGRKAELGRFCLHPAARDAGLLRLCWAALVRIVTGQGVDHLFGCSSFLGADPNQHRAALAWLGQNACGPADFIPSARTRAAIPLAGQKASAQGLPALLRFYLSLGGWVADHAMIDADLDTVHVFTALNIRALPPSVAKRLLAMAG